MTELKTLKDLMNYEKIEGNTIDEIGIHRLNLIDSEELKQEAIKWVKFYEDRERIKFELFRDFFNLTEVDIKNG